MAVWAIVSPELVVKTQAWKPSNEDAKSGKDYQR